MKYTEEQMEELSQYLQGTTKSLYDGYEELFNEEPENEDEVVQYVENQYQKCNNCGWWKEMSEFETNEDGEIMCCDCIEENE